MTITRGPFTLTDEGIEGPADYMDTDRPGALVERMLAGDHAGLNTLIDHNPYGQVEGMILTILCSDWASWKNVNRLLA